MTTREPNGTSGGTRQFAGVAGHIAGYDVFIAGDGLHVHHAASGRHWQHAVPNYGTSLGKLARRPGFRLG